MRKSFLLGALVSAAAFALAAFALRHDIAPAPAAKMPTPLKLSDLTLDRVFRETITTTGPGVTVQLPPTGGLVITSVSGDPVLNSAAVQVGFSVNGAPLQVVKFGLYNYGVNLGQSVPLDPPIIARPGDTLMITTSGYPTTIGGFTVYPGEV